MTDTFIHGDVDFDTDEIDRDEWYIEIREIWTDSTSEDYVVDDTNTLKEFLSDLKKGHDDAVLARLTPEQREHYDRFAEETERRCDGSCNEICWYDLQDRDHWLNEVAPNGVDIQWLWMFGDDVQGPGGSSFLSESNTVIDEGPGLAGEIWRQVEWTEEPH